MESLESRIQPATSAPVQSYLGTFVAPKPWGELAATSTKTSASTIVETSNGREQRVIATTSTPSSVDFANSFTGDFNGDGLADFTALVDGANWRTFVSRRDGFNAWNWGGGWDNTEGWQSFHVGDFNGDGKDDLAGLTWSGRWWFGFSTGSSFTLTYGGYASALFFTSFHVGDFNGDGRDDVMAMDYSGNWSYFRSTGARFIDVAVRIPWGSTGRWSTLQVGDFNGDGVDDIAGLRWKSQWFVLLGSPSGFKQQRWKGGDLFSWKRWSTFVVGDVNKDGKSDILAMEANGAWTLIKSLGANFMDCRWSSAWVGASSSWQKIEAVDLNGDGFTDLLGWHRSGGLLGLITTSRGAVSRSLGRQGAIGAGSQQAMVGDFNGDSKSDLLVQTSAGELYAGLGAGLRFYFGVASEKPFFVVAPWDVYAIRRNPNVTASVFRRYLPALRSQLEPRFGPLSDNALAMVFTTMVSYQHASYRAVEDPAPGPDPFDVKSLLASAKLVCTEYVYLSHHLYRKIYAKAADERLTITSTGWDDGPFGNHAQMIIQDRRTSLLLDPTTGFIAATDLASLRSGTAIASYRMLELSHREEATPRLLKALERFRNNVKSSLLEGRYNEARLLYVYDVDKILRYKLRR